MEKTHWLFVEGTQGDANFLVGIQKYIIPGALYRADPTKDMVICKSFCVL